MVDFPSDSCLKKVELSFQTEQEKANENCLLEINLMKN